MCIHKAENEWQARQATPAASQQQHPSQAAGWEMKWEKVHFSMFSKALKPKLIDIKISHEHTPANIFIYISVNFPHLSEISDGLCCVCMLTPSRHDWRGLVFTLLFFCYAGAELLLLLDGMGFSRPKRVELSTTTGQNIQQCLRLIWALFGELEANKSEMERK